MEVSIESYVEKLVPWEFNIKWQGKLYPVRPLTMGDVMVIESMGTGPTEAKSMARMREVVQGLFTAPAPDVGQWRIEALMQFLFALMQYFRDSTKKNMTVLMMKVES